MKQLIKSFIVQDDYVRASLPTTQEVDDGMFTDMDVSLVIAISLSLVFTVLEAIFLFCQTLSNLAATLSLFCHTIACTFLLKFIIDFHTVAHFWMSFVLFNFPPIIYQIYVFLFELNKQKFC